MMKFGTVLLCGFLGGLLVGVMGFSVCLLVSDITGQSATAIPFAMWGTINGASAGLIAGSIAEYA